MLTTGIRFTLSTLAATPIIRSMNPDRCCLLQLSDSSNRQTRAKRQIRLSGVHGRYTQFARTNLQRLGDLLFRKQLLVQLLVTEFPIRLVISAERRTPKEAPANNPRERE